MSDRDESAEQADLNESSQEQEARNAELDCSPSSPAVDTKQQEDSEFDFLKAFTKNDDWVNPEFEKKESKE
ncbi:hypothetical protein MMC29_004272 [Sticta canariensis]|nr:hypothetical protein [Sticta canariensis]